MKVNTKHSRDRQNSQNTHIFDICYQAPKTVLVSRGWLYQNIHRTHIYLPTGIENIIIIINDNKRSEIQTAEIGYVPDCPSSQVSSFSCQRRESFVIER